MCQAKPGKRCQTHNVEAFKSARRKHDLLLESYRNGTSSLDEIIESSLKLNVARVAVTSPHTGNSEDVLRSQEFDKLMGDERGLAFDESMRFQELAGGWGADDDEFKEYHKQWVKSTDEYLNCKSVADTPRNNIPPETMAFASVKMRESHVRVNAYKQLMNNHIRNKRTEAYEKYGEEYVNKNGVPGTENYRELEELRRERQPQTKTAPLTQESISLMMSGVDERKDTTPSPTSTSARGLVSESISYGDRLPHNPQRAGTERWNRSEGMFKNGTSQSERRSVVN